MNYPETEQFDEDDVERQHRPAFITIHRSGEGADALSVDSYNNGWGYAIHFGEAGSPMLTRWFQDEDALTIREAYDALETAQPDTPCREHWLTVLDPYLG